MPETSSGTAVIMEPTTPTLRQVFDEHARFTGRVLGYLGVPPADVEDACQDVFLVVHRKLDQFRPGSSMRTWLYAICMRVASDRRNRAHVRRERQTAVPPEEITAASQDTAIELAQARHALRLALDALDADKRAVFVLYEIEELAMTEIAEAVGCPLQTAYSRLHAARKSVVEAMKRYEAGLPAQGSRLAKRVSP